MGISDSELMMIEQLTYFGVDEGDVGKTIGEILSSYTDEKLAKMTAGGGKDADRAAVIRHLQENDQLNDLKLHSTMEDGDDKTLALCFTDEDHPGEAIVAFKGTTSKEWGDNVEGLNVADTQRQLEAKAFIDELPFDNVAVVGHSKGGNKAMYVSILCDKVTKCVAMDGQGFSAEFIEKYAPQIAERSGIVKNYSIQTDYVHALLFQIPGSEQLYCEGYRIGKDAARHHEPFTFFQIDKDGNIVCENGVPVVVTEKDGVKLSEDPSVKMLHELTVFVLNVAPDGDKEKIVTLLATLADMAMSGEYSAEEIFQYLLDNSDDAALVLAYIVKYMETYDLTTDDIDALLEMLGFKELDEYFSVEVLGETYGVTDLINLIYNNLTDGKNDPLINLFFAAFDRLLESKGYKISLKDFWLATEGYVKKIPKVSKGDGRREPKVQPGVATGSGVITVDTAGLRYYANRLNNVNARLVKLDQRMDNLYKEVGWRDLFTLIKADLLTGYSVRIQNCKRYLEETANDFDTTERNVSNQF